MVILPNAGRSAAGSAVRSDPHCTDHRLHHATVGRRKGTDLQRKTFRNLPHLHLISGILLGRQDHPLREAPRNPSVRSYAIDRAGCEGWRSCAHDSQRGLSDELAAWPHLPSKSTTLPHPALNGDRAQVGQSERTPAGTFQGQEANGDSVGDQVRTHESLDDARNLRLDLGGVIDPNPISGSAISMPAGGRIQSFRARFTKNPLHNRLFRIREPLGRESQRDGCHIPARLAPHRWADAWILLDRGGRKSEN